MYIPGGHVDLVLKLRSLFNVESRAHTYVRPARSLIDRLFFELVR